MPHTQKALEAFFKNFDAYRTHLENQSHENAKAEGLAKMMVMFNVVLFALIMQASYLNLCFV